MKTAELHSNNEKETVDKKTGYEVKGIELKFSNPHIFATQCHSP